MKYDFRIDMSQYNSLTIILRNIVSQSKVLEFGPAAGYMTCYMKESLGCDVTCIEIDKEAAAVSSKYCEKMLIADINNMKWTQELAGEEFDHIIFADVLEHLKNPDRVLLEAGKFLKRCGTILTSIPNIGHSAIIMDLLQGKFEYRPLGLLDESHIRFFTRKSIYELLEKAGLQSIEEYSICLRPEQTEIGQNYRHFSDAVACFLENRADAHVYQFVNISKVRQKV